MNITVFTYETKETLKNNIKHNIQNYKESDSEWIYTYIRESGAIDYSSSFYIDRLDMSEDKPEKTDFKNIKILYSGLNDISDSQASDERFWSGLAHNEFWDYMQYRWPLSKATKDEETFIKKNYFFAHGNTRSLMTHGLARLWWMGRLTYDRDNTDDPYWIIRYLSTDINGKGFPLFGSNFSNNLIVLKVFIKTVMDVESKNRDLTREEFNKVIQMINFIGGISVIDSMVDKELKKIIETFIINNIYNKDES
jgi:hypothetical protein